MQKVITKYYLILFVQIISYQTTVYKAGLSTVGDLYNLVTKNVTKYAVLTTLKFSKLQKKTSPIFLKKFFVTSFLKIFSKIGDFFYNFGEFLKLLEQHIL